MTFEKKERNVRAGTVCRYLSIDSIAISFKVSVLLLFFYYYLLFALKKDRWSSSLSQKKDEEFRNLLIAVFYENFENFFRCKHSNERRSIIGSPFFLPQLVGNMCLVALKKMKEKLWLGLDFVFDFYMYFAISK